MDTLEPADPIHESHMARALRLAQRGQGQVEPNPMVGAVITQDNRVIAEGFHERHGGPHAEINALHAAGTQARDATLYITLEPCCHHGKTPPCTHAIIDAGIAHAVVATADPFPQVAGRGIDQLRNAGIRVTLGVAEPQARQLNAPFIKRVTTGLPWVIAKWAQTLDGKTATAQRDSKWISNPTSRQHVHHTRARVDAIITGIGTALADDPQLTARDVPILRTAQRIVVDPEHQLPPTAKLFQGNPPARVWDRLDAQHLRSIPDATNVLIEAGGGLVGHALQQHLIDELHVYLAPKILGDANALDPVRSLDTPHITDALPLQLADTQRFGDDLFLRYLIHHAPTTPA